LMRFYDGNNLFRLTGPLKHSSRPACSSHRVSDVMVKLSRRNR
jgi:hypothetical protein